MRSPSSSHLFAENTHREWGIIVAPVEWQYRCYFTIANYCLPYRAAMGRAVYNNPQEFQVLRASSISLFLILSNNNKKSFPKQIKKICRLKATRRQRVSINSKHLACLQNRQNKTTTKKEIAHLTRNDRWQLTFTWKHASRLQIYNRPPIYLGVRNALSRWTR